MLLPLLLASVAAAALAPGAPGSSSTWTNGNKQGVGTSNSLESKVWFTLGDGALQEVYYPAVDKANTRLLELVVTDGRGLLERESEDTEHRVLVPDPYAPVFTQINTSKSGRYRITKTTVADPERDALLIRVVFEALKPGSYRLLARFDPSINNSGLHDTGWSSGSALLSSDGPVAAALAASPPFSRLASGFDGSLDSLKDGFSRAADGNVVQWGELPAAGAKPFTLALGFGTEGDLALAAARGALRKGFAKAREEYARGWREWLETLREPPPEFREQYLMSAIMLKVHEDKTWRGAGAASLSIPWGDAQAADEPSVGGYHLVWSRDLYHVATALHAVGDKPSADRALDYLLRVQQRPDGSFPQNSWLDGRPYWSSLQLDEVAYPLILAWQLGRFDGETYARHIKPAANFIAARGPATPQERWEEEAGYSPSTLAAEVAGLVCAAWIARANGDEESSRSWLAKADEWNVKVEAWTAAASTGGARYIRISPDGRPNEPAPLELNNGGGTFDQREILDAGFLELVRLGLRCPDDPTVARSVEAVDQVLRVDTPAGPGFYRYNHDGYGEKPDGRGYDGTGVGRLWPLLAGERGEYELALGRDAKPWLRAMQGMASESRMLPEQVWDRAQSPRPHLRFGKGTGSATPLAWTNAQFIRLVAGVAEGRVLEMPEPVRRRYCPR